MTQSTSEIVYPDRNDYLMAERTQICRWIIFMKENLEILFADNPDVFVANNILWYPIEGEPRSCVAADVMVVFCRPKGDRGSYKQWQEDNITPQVIFSISTTVCEITSLAASCYAHGVEEFYILDLDEPVEFSGSIRQDSDEEKSHYKIIDDLNGWVSARLGIRFEQKEGEWEIYSPNGERFLTSVELAQQKSQEQQRAEEAIAQLEQERQRYQALVERLRQRGIDPEQL